MRVLDENTLPQVWVIELSSFQLDGVVGFEPHAAAVLNLTQDHLDWHGDMAAYGAAKARIFGERTVAVVNRDDRGGRCDGHHAAAAPLAKTGKPSKARTSRCRARSCASGSTRRRIPATTALCTEGGMAWLVRAMPIEADGASASEDEASRAAPAAPDAGRCAARARAPQRGQCAGRAGAGHSDRLSAGADAARPARIRRRAAPRAAGGPRRRGGGVRRQQGHQRRCHGGGAGRARRRQGARQAGGDPRGRRQGAGLRAAGRTGGAPCTRRGVDRARRAARSKQC